MADQRTDEEHEDYLRKLALASTNQPDPQYATLVAIAKDFYDRLDKETFSMGVIWQGTVIGNIWVTSTGTSFVAIEGERESDGQAIRIVVHYSQLNIAFVSLPRKGPKSPFGFHPQK